MWEGIVGIVNSANFLKLGIFITILIGILIILVKLGLISVNTKHVTIGESNDRLLIRNQFEYAETSCKGQFRKIKDYCENEYHARFIISEVIDLFQQMIVYNHIDANDDAYVRSKKNLVLLTIQKYTTNEHFFTPEFRGCCDKFVEELIRDLYHMKKLMSN